MIKQIIVTVVNDSEQFGSSLPVGTIIVDSNTNKVYRTTALATNTDTLSAVSKNEVVNNPFNQSLNTTDSALFSQVNLDGLSVEVQTITNDYTTTDTDCFFKADCSSNDVNINLSTAIVGKVYTVKRIDNSTNSLNILGTIDGNTNITLTGQYQAINLIYDGTDWSIF